MDIYQSGCLPANHMGRGSHLELGGIGSICGVVVRELRKWFAPAHYWNLPLRSRGRIGQPLRALRTRTARPSLNSSPTTQVGGFSPWLTYQPNWSTIVTSS